MKKIYVVITLIIFVVLGVKGTAVSYQFKWNENSCYIEVPLGGNIQSYVNVPEAKLYRDGMELTDAKIDYITTGDWLYLLTDVDTTKTGIYQVWYKAVEEKYKPGQCKGYKTLVTFNVVDLEKPVFVDYPSNIQYYIGAEKPKYEEKVLVKDNSESVTLTVDDSLVLYEQPGVYPLYYKASDGANVEIKEVMVQVIDSVGPIITFLGENNHLVFEKGSNPSLVEYFKVNDKIDGDVTNSIRYDSFSTSEEGIFPVTVRFYDLNQNEASIEIEIEIVDKDKPCIELRKQQLVLEWGSDYHKSFLENIKRAYIGNFDIIKEVVIDDSSVKDRIGNYTITYRYKKGDKEASEICEVSILTSTPPIIMVENISIPVGKKCDIASHLQVQDASDPDIASKVIYDDSSVDYTKEGVYPVLVSVTNSSGVCATNTLYVTVTSTTAETKEGISYTILIPIVLAVIAIGIGVAIFLLIKKKKLKS